MSDRDRQDGEVADADTDRPTPHDPAVDSTSDGPALKVLVVTTVHTPLDARIHHRQIRALLAAGAEVTYAAPWSATDTPITAAAAGVVTVDLPRATGRRRLRALGAARRIVTRLAASHDVVLLHDPELVLAVPPRLARRTPIVLDVHEDLAASVVDRPWIPGLLRPLVRRLARRLETHAEQRLAGLLLAEGRYQDRFGGDHLVVPNLPWLPHESPPAGTEHRVVYVGRLSIGRGTLELLSMARDLARDPWNPRVEVVGAADHAVRQALRSAHERGILTWHGFLPNDQAMALVAGSLAGIAPLRDMENYRHSMPTKVVEYLAHGVPAIVTPLPEAARLVEASGGGEVVPFRSAVALSEAVARLVRDPQRAIQQGAAGRRFLAATLSWDAEAPRFVAELRALAGRGTRSERGVPPGAAACPGHAVPPVDPVSRTAEVDPLLGHRQERPARPPSVQRSPSLPGQGTDRTRPDASPSRASRPGH